MCGIAGMLSPDHRELINKMNDAMVHRGPDDDGFYLYRHMLPPDLPNLAFIGRATSFVSVLTYSLQARWLAELIAGRIVLPEREAMLREIEEMKAWKRSWMPFSPARSARYFFTRSITTTN